MRQPVCLSTRPFSAPLTLGVTPSVNPDNRISLELNIAKSTITNATTGSLDTNTVTTNVIVENGGTVVIGGFARESELSTSQDACPVPRRPAVCRQSIQDHDQEPVAQRAAGLHYAPHSHRIAYAAIAQTQCLAFLGPAYAGPMLLQRTACQVSWVGLSQSAHKGSISRLNQGVKGAVAASPMACTAKIQS
jgi:hypothetical protein